jgi:hypothetical protein
MQSQPATAFPAFQDETEAHVPVRLPGILSALIGLSRTFLTTGTRRCGALRSDGAAEKAKVLQLSLITIAE